MAGILAAFNAGLRRRRRGGSTSILANASGATAVEFGLVGAPFLFLLMAVFEAGLVTLAQQSLNDGLDPAARQIFTGQFQEGANSSLPADRLKTLICNGVVYITCANLLVEVTTSTNFGSRSTNNPYDSSTGDVSPSFGNTFQCPTGNDIVTVRAAAVVPRFFSLISLAPKVASGGQLVVATAVFRAEPYSSGGC